MPRSSQPERRMVRLTRPEGSAPEDFHLSRRGLVGLLFAGYAAAAFSAKADPIRTDETDLATQTVMIQAADRPIPAYLARPASNAHAPFPAVIVVSEIFGANEYIRDICRRLAKLGYVAIAPAFFVRAGDPSSLTDMDAIAKIVQATPDAQVLSDVGATIAFLKGQDYVIGDRLAVTGFSWGGKIAWLACESFPDFRAGAAWYGRLAPPTEANAVQPPGALYPIAKVADLKAPVLGLYAGGDPISQAVPAMRDALDAAHKTGTEIIIYPDAQHGFHADDRPSYNEADAEDGWMRMLAHFALNGAVSHHDPANRSSRGRGGGRSRGHGHGRGHGHSHGHAKSRRSDRPTRPHRARRRRGRRG
jgi:carboxymethylenebutenolidase